jgi:vacuolar-type H+-ATPase subunit I/STV1
MYKGKTCGLDKRNVFRGETCLSVGIALFLYGWSLGFSRYAIWFELLGLILSGTGFVISFYGVIADLVKPQWVSQEIPGYQKLILKVLAYFGLALGLIAVVVVIVTLALWLMDCI